MSSSGLLWPERVAAQGTNAGNPAAQPGLTLEQLLSVDVQHVTGASRFNQEVVDAPAEVTIITREEIYTFGYRTLGDVLRGVRGYYVSNDRNYSYLGVRGFSRPGDYNTRVLLLLDGHRMNDNVYDQAAIGTDFPLDMDLVDRIEIVRGPASSVYGASAFFGVINVITVRPTNAGRLFGTLEAGAQRTVDVRGGASRAFSERTEGLFAVTGYRTSGQPAIVFPDLAASTPTRGVSRGADGDSFWNVFGTLRRGPWNGELVWGSRTKEVPTGAFSTALGDPRTQTVDNRGFAALTYDGSWRGAAITWRSAFDRYRYDGSYAPATADGSPATPYTDYGVGEWLSSELTVSRTARRQLLTAGGEVRANLRQDQGVHYPDDPAASFDTPHRSAVMSLYVDDQLTLSPKLVVHAGARYDDMDPGILDKVSPRVALVYKPRRGDAFKVIFGEAFRAPNAYELYYYTSGEAAPLAGEKIRSLDLAWERYFGKRARISAVTFLYDTRDLITQSPGDSIDGIQFLNRGRTRAAGFGLETETALPAGLHATGSYTFTGTHDRDSGLELTNSPHNLFQARLAVPIGRSGLLAAVEHLLVGERDALDGSLVPPTRLWNLTVTRRQMLHGFGIGLDVKNLFNRANSDVANEEHPSASIPQSGRTIRARVTWQF